MTIVDPAAYYGLPQAPAAPPRPGGGAASATTPVAATVANTVKGELHQDPVFVLVILLGVAFLLARGAEHGISLGFKVQGRA